LPPSPKPWRNIAIINVRHRLVETSQQNYYYGPSEVPLQPGKRYAWQVQVSDLLGKAAFENSGLQQLWFQWQPRHIALGTTVSYTLKLFELTPDDDPQDAAIRGLPTATLNVGVGTNYVWKPSDPTLDPTKKYAWTIEVDNDAKNLFNDMGLGKGVSDVATFFYGERCKTPPQPTLTNNEQTLQWQPTPNATTYRIQQLVMNDNKLLENNFVDTNETTYTFATDPNRWYEYKVQALCEGDLQSSFSDKVATLRRRVPEVMALPPPQEDNKLPTVLNPFSTPIYVDADDGNKTMPTVEDMFL
jgi:hypothetical protein